MRWLLGRMDVLGFEHTFQDAAGNAVGILGEGPKQGVLLGHIDTVPGDIPVRIEGDDLYGRGSVDAKGPLASFTDAVAQVGPRPDWQFVVIGAVEEERNSEGARYVAGQYRPEFVVVGEPSGWDRITIGYKGITITEVFVRRRLTHTAGLEASACDIAIWVWDSIKAFTQVFNRERSRLFEQVTLSLRAMESGEDEFEEWAKLTIGTRLPVDLSPKDWFTQLQAISTPFQAECMAIGFPIPAYRTSKNNYLVRAFLKSIRAQGGRPGFLVKSGTADLNIVAPAWGCPAVVYGPGDSTLDHTPDEHISLAEYKKTVAVLADVLATISAA